MGLLFSLVAFFAAFLGGRRSIGHGMVAVVWVGGMYGIVRANFLDLFCYFMYDMAVVGFYVARFADFFRSSARTANLHQWTALLFAWPLLYFGLGFLFPQHLLIQMVGLRAALWFLPFLLIGGKMTGKDIQVLAVGVAAFNIVTLAFALSEYFLGLELFYPRNAITEAIIYKSNDIAGGSFRLPSTFSHAHSYGGYLVVSFPLVISRWAKAGLPLWERILMTAAVASALFGVLLCGARSPVVALGFLVLYAGFCLRHRPEIIVVLVLGVAGVIYQASLDERLQRSATLEDTQAVAERVGGSANVGILELMVEYPFGAGFGSAAMTSVPTFLADLNSGEKYGAENEYSRIGIEQSVIGVVLWLAFLFWLLQARLRSEQSNLTLAMMGACIFFSWSTAVMGAGLLMSIPGTAILFMQMGVLVAAPVRYPGNLNPQTTGTIK